MDCKNIFLIFGITNVPSLIDTALVRRFSLKRFVYVKLSEEEFKNYIEYLSQPLNWHIKNENMQKLYTIYKQRSFTTGDIKSICKVLFLDVLCMGESVNIDDRAVELFEREFSTCEHLNGIYQDFIF